MRHCHGDGVWLPHVVTCVRSGRPKRDSISLVVIPTSRLSTRSGVSPVPPYCGADSQSIRGRWSQLRDLVTTMHWLLLHGLDALLCLAALSKSPSRLCAVSPPRGYGATLLICHVEGSVFQVTKNRHNFVELTSNVIVEEVVVVKLD